MPENAIQMTLLEMVAQERNPDLLMKAVRRRYPNLKKKDIIRAAFAAIIQIADRDMERAILLQKFALGGRGADD